MHIDLNADDADLPVGLPIEVRVKQGMVLLDEKHGPEWVFRIDVDTLELDSTCSCVLGQLHGWYDTGACAVGLHGYDARAAHGFTLSYGEDDDEHTERTSWNALTAAWTNAILARRLELAS